MSAESESAALDTRPEGAQIELEESAAAARGELAPSVTTGPLFVQGIKEAVFAAIVAFGMFLPLYDVFHLTRAPGLKLPGGRPVFPGVPAQAPEQVMTKAGLREGKTRVLDAPHNLTVTEWRRR